jgi:hypothetical protein
MAVIVAGVNPPLGMAIALYWPSDITVVALSNPFNPVPPSVVDGAKSAPIAGIVFPK